MMPYGFTCYNTGTLYWEENGIIVNNGMCEELLKIRDMNFSEVGIYDNSVNILHTFSTLNYWDLKKIKKEYSLIKILVKV